MYCHGVRQWRRSRSKNSFILETHREEEEESELCTRGRDLANGEAGAYGAIRAT